MELLPLLLSAPFPEAQRIPDTLILRIDASFGFANAEFLKDFILTTVRESSQPIKYVIIDASSVNDLDLTALQALESIAQFLKEKGVELYITGAKGPVRDVFERTGFFDRLGRDHFFLSPHRAVQFIKERKALPEQETSV